MKYLDIEFESDETYPVYYTNDFEIISYNVYFKSFDNIFPKYSLLYACLPISGKNRVFEPTIWLDSTCRLDGSDWTTTPSVTKVSSGMYVHMCTYICVYVSSRKIAPVSIGKSVISGREGHCKGLPSNQRHCDSQPMGGWFVGDGDENEKAKRFWYVNRLIRFEG